MGMIKGVGIRGVHQASGHISFAVSANAGTGVRVNVEGGKLTLYCRIWLDGLFSCTREARWICLEFCARAMISLLIVVPEMMRLLDLLCQR